MNVQDFDNLPDNQIVEIVTKRDKDLYKVVVQRYQEKLLRYVRYFIPEVDKALDVVQEVFIKAYINLNSFDPKLKFSSWIYRIAHNEAINALKKHEKEVSLDVKSEVYQFADERLNVEKHFQQKEEREMVRECLFNLPLKYQEVLTLFYLEEQSYEEISDVLRISTGTVGTRISRGKKMMEKYCNNLNGGGLYERVKK